MYQKVYIGKRRYYVLQALQSHKQESMRMTDKTTIERKCEACEWYDPYRDRGSGLCRIAPPSANTKNMLNRGSWPMVKANDWCGMFKERGR